MKNFLGLIYNYNLVTLGKALVSEVKRICWRQTVLGSYSQNYEDLIVEKILDKKKGYYLEIGAYHPKRLSNTYRFYKKGWKGTVIEPNPKVKEIFKRTRPKDMFLNMGIADKDGFLDYYEFLIPALNTFLKKAADKNVDQGHKLIGVLKVKTVKIDKIATGKIDFLSLDTEGFDRMILDNWPWEKCKPMVICVEEKILRLKDYKLFAKTKDNFIFVLQK